VRHATSGLQHDEYAMSKATLQTNQLGVSVEVSPCIDGLVFEESLILPDPALQRRKADLDGVVIW